MKNLAIIGGGWAGLACAHVVAQANAQSQEPVAIWLFEASPFMGGRARGIAWETELGQTAVDNGQHLLLGAYEQTWQLLKEAGVLLERGWSDAPMHWASLEPESGNRYALLRIPPQAWPWRFFGQTFPAFIDKKHARPWGLLDRLALANALRQAIQSKWHARGSAFDWLSQVSMPAGVRHQFWRPLIEGALNTSWTEASASVFLRVVKDSLTGPSGATNCWHPRADLSQNAVDPLCLSLNRQGVRLIPRCRIAALRQEGPSATRSSRRRWRLEPHVSSQDQAAAVGLEHEVFDAVVLATPAYEARRLWRQSGLPETPAIKRMDQMDWRGVMTLYIHLSQAQALQLGPIRQWLCSLPGLNDQSHIGLARQPSENGSQVVSVVASGLDPQQDRSAVADSLWQAAQHYLRPLGLETLRTLPHRFTDDPRATWACTERFIDNEPSAMHDPTSACLTGLDGVLRASDDLTAGYPACIEAAVRSGRVCGSSLVAQAPRKAV